MADKKKPNSADERPQESDRQYLERSNIGNMMRDVLAKVISNRPEDPIAFLADYFDSMEDQSNLVLKARHLIEMTHHSRPVFDSNIRMAYDLLQKQKVGKKLQGLTGAAYNDLIKTLCRDIPQPVTQKLLRKIECLEYESITYDVFRSSVFTCCVLQDYVSLAASLFQALDFQKTGKVDKALCDAVQDQLKVALGGSRLDARRIVEAGYNLGPDGLFYALERAMRRGGHHHGVQTLEQFTSELCEAFLSRVIVVCPYPVGVFHYGRCRVAELASSTRGHIIVASTSVSAFVILATITSTLSTLNDGIWKNPCGGSSSVGQSQISVTVQAFSPEKVLRNIMTKLSESRDILRRLKEEYRNNRLPNSFNECGKNLDVAFLYVEQFPLPQPILSIFKDMGNLNVTSTFKRDYEVISTVLVFFEQIRWDEEAYNDNILGSVISDVINKFAESLCNIKTFLSQSNVTISSNMDRWSVMLPKYRVMNRVGRTDRDYVLVKQADALIGRLIFKYTAMKNILF